MDAAAGYDGDVSAVAYIKVVIYHVGHAGFVHNYRDVAGLALAIR